MSEELRFDEKVVLARGCLQQPRVYMEHTATTSAGDSGWYVGPVEGSNDVQEYEALYVYQLQEHRPALLQATALPVGFLVVFDGDHIEAVLDGNGTNIWKK